MNKQLNGLGQAVANAGVDARYDAQARNLLANKPFLAWILKYTATEFASLMPDEIISHIDNHPKVASVAVFPGEIKSRGQVRIKRMQLNVKKLLHLLQ